MDIGHGQLYVREINVKCHSHNKIIDNTQNIKLLICLKFVIVYNITIDDHLNLTVNKKPLFCCIQFS